MIQNFCESNASIFSSKITNTYLRLGRSYVPPKYNKNLGRANTVIFPIYATTEDLEEVKYQICSGMLVRGPNHARIPTDRINFLTIELLHRKEGLKYIPYIKNVRYIETSTRAKLLIRTIAICRSDPNYLIFINDALFVACKLVGELIISDPNIPASS